MCVALVEGVAACCVKGPLRASGLQRRGNGDGPVCLRSGCRAAVAGVMARTAAERLTLGGVLNWFERVGGAEGGGEHTKRHRDSFLYILLIQISSVMQKKNSHLIYQYKTPYLPTTSPPHLQPTPPQHPQYIVSPSRPPLSGTRPYSPPSTSPSATSGPAKPCPQTGPSRS